MFSDFPNQITQLALPLSSAKTLGINAKTIFIITDKMNWLRFPQQADSLAIYGATNLLIQLNKLPWLLEKTVYFWGDISLASLRQLSELRQFLPQTEAFLMDKKTLKKYVDLVEPEKETMNDISLLKAEEYELFLALKERKVKLDQKHILQKQLNQFLNG
ncbi:MAG: Wadjet anti-phage system protein JetD domain-containing protein [Saprospiraceae bacterium]